MIGRRAIGVATSLATLLLAACSVPHVETQVSPVSGGSLGLSATDAPAITDRWWAALRDPQLDRIMADALAGSPTFAAALARVRLAEASVETQRAATRPQISADAQEQRTRLSGRYIIPPPYAGSDRFVGTAQANLRWTLDFWGRSQAMVDQARATARAAALDADAARLTLSGAVVQTYLSLAQAELQSAIAGRFTQSRERALALVRSRIRNQLASRFDERTADTLLTEARQAQIRADGRRETLVHALAALAGRGADYYPTIGASHVTLDAVLPLPAALPADLLGRRPDLLAGLARVDAAAAGRKVARTAYYPNVDLLASAGFQAIGLGALFSTAAGTYGAGPSVHLPIFEGGRLRADYEGATAQQDLAAADYNEAVLRAVRDTADAISDVRTVQADAAQQALLVASLQDVVRLNRTRINTGLGSQLDILDADTRLLTAQQAQIDIVAEAAVRRVQLLVAVGGGFDPAAASRNSTTKGKP